MIVTNDVALISFAPLTLLLFQGSEPRSTIITLVAQTVAANLGSMMTPIGNPQNIYLVAQTVAANLGSMMTPIGNPQNIYLYSAFELELGEFLTAIAPYGIIGFLASIAPANLGSMMTPIGNPQNIYLYSAFELELGEFLTAIAPYGIIGFLASIAPCMLIPNTKATLGKAADSKVDTRELELGEFLTAIAPYGIIGFLASIAPCMLIPNTKATLGKAADSKVDTRLALAYGFLFLLALACVGRVVSWELCVLITLIGCLIFDRSVLKHLDYSLLITFAPIPPRTRLRWKGRELGALCAHHSDWLPHIRSQRTQTPRLQPSYHLCLLLHLCGKHQARSRHRQHPAIHRRRA